MGKPAVDDIRSNELTVRVDPVDDRNRCAGHIDHSILAQVQHEAMRVAIGIVEVSDNLVRAVSVGCRVDRARHVDRDELELCTSNPRKTQTQCQCNRSQSTY